MLKDVTKYQTVDYIHRRLKKKEKTNYRLFL